jgi:hypothetical protein
MIDRATALVVLAGLLAGRPVRADAPARADAPVRADAPGPATSAAAEPQDPAVDEAGDANLEPNADRNGVTFAVVLGAGLMVGIGIQGSVGRGGALGLRLGRVATRHTVMTFEVSGGAVLHEPHVMKPSVETNSNTDVLVGAQYYLNPSLWVRGAGGVGIYHGNQVELSAGGLGDVRLIGPTMLGGLGVDIVRFRSIVLGIETGTSALISRSGVGGGGGGPRGPGGE